MKFFNNKILEKFGSVFVWIATVTSFILIFVEIPEDQKPKVAVIFILTFIIIYLFIAICWRTRKSLTLKITNTNVVVKQGDLFKQKGLKVIAFNEYFDTQVDNVIIAKASLNGKYINDYCKNVEKLDEFIELNLESKGKVVSRSNGKKIQYPVGTLLEVEDEYVLAAMTRFTVDNKAELSMAEYIKFLLDLWDQLNVIFGSREISIPLLGSGITRINEYSSIDDEELLKLMLWSFEISKIKFKHPAKLNIVLTKETMKNINLISLK